MEKLKFRAWDEKINQYRSDTIVLGAEGQTFVLPVNNGKMSLKEIEDLKTIN